MGRHSGWLTAATAKTYRERLVRPPARPAPLQSSFL